MDLLQVFFQYIRWSGLWKALRPDRCLEKLQSDSRRCEALHVYALYDRPSALLAGRGPYLDTPQGDPLVVVFQRQGLDKVTIDDK